MTDNLYQLIGKAKNRDEESVIKMLNRFFPLIKKYSRKLNYDGAKSDLIITFLEIIEKIPIFKEKQLREDKYIVGYIKKSIKNKYIKLSKKYKKIKENEISSFIDIAKSEEKVNWEDKIDISLAYNRLSSLQKRVIYEEFIEDIPEKKIAKNLKISRQAVNRIKNRGLKKIREYVGEV